MADRLRQDGHDIIDPQRGLSGLRVGIHAEGVGDRNEHVVPRLVGQIAQHLGVGVPAIERHGGVVDTADRHVQRANCRDWVPPHVQRRKLRELGMVDVNWWGALQRHVEELGGTVRCRLDDQGKLKNRH